MIGWSYRGGPPNPWVISQLFFRRKQLSDVKGAAITEGFDAAQIALIVNWSIDLADVRDLLGYVQLIQIYHFFIHRLIQELFGRLSST